MSGAIFVLPVTMAGQQGPVAAWMSSAGWASAARRVLGESWLVTPEGLVDPGAARRRASSRHLAAMQPERSWRRRIPTVVKTAIKDTRQWRRARGFHVDRSGPWDGSPVEFVWQRHELFHRAGLDLADELEVPSVLFVPAPLVWEAERWNVRRPGWGPFLERQGEQPSLKRAALVACGSDLVAEHVRRLGAPEARVLVTPTGVDLDDFSAPVDSDTARARLQLADQFVVGWVGSFRGFHAVDQLVAAIRDLGAGVTLLMVGDGPERARAERLATINGLTAVFTGTVPHEEIPLHLAAMDAAVVLAAPDQPFHYSPLKLAEYLAAGRAVVAPRVSQIEARLVDGRDALLVEPGDPSALVAALGALRSDPLLRQRLGTAARVAAEEWSWDEQVRRIVAALP